LLHQDSLCVDDAEPSLSALAMIVRNLEPSMNSNLVLMNVILWHCMRVVVVTLTTDKGMVVVGAIYYSFLDSEPSFDDRRWVLNGTLVACFYWILCGSYCWVY